MDLSVLLKIFPGGKKILDWKEYRNITDYRALPIERRVEIMMRRYEKKFGYTMDINHPQSFTEKMQWYKAYYIGDGHLDRIVDKYLFKQYIAEKLGEGYTVPLIGVWSDIRHLEKDWKKLPEDFCLKSTVQSEGKCIEFVHGKSSVDFRTKKQEWEKWFQYKYTLVRGLTQAYRNCIPRVIAENYLENVKNQLFDYKFFCFDGEPFCIESAKERFEGSTPTFTFYDLGWNKLDVTSGGHPNGDVPKPKHLSEMIEIAAVLSKGFPHVRVDFFDTDEKLYVAEMTFYTGGGYSLYEPQSFNEEMGKLFKLPIDNQ